MPMESKSSPPLSPWDDALRFHFAEISSTNDAAMQWLRDSPAGQIGIFTAAHQTAGRGQQGRIWEHRAQQDLAWSLAVHFSTPRNAQTIDTAFWLQLNMIISEAVKRCIVNSLDSLHASNVRIKWPNDLLIQHEASWKKCAGILLENHWKGPNLHGIVIGIGMNIASYSSAKDWVALQAFSNQTLKVSAYQAQLEQELSALFPLSSLGDSPISSDRLEQYQRNLFGWNELLPFEWHGAVHKARFLGITETGQAQLQWVDGPDAGQTTSHVSAGDLRWVLQPQL
jgi:biotin-[acetyl-CoA-carboxylase] ligase BirA-like protein